MLDETHGAAKLREFCKAQDINEVYVSFSAKDGASEDGRLTDLIARLHRANIRVEALLSSTDADEAGKAREKLLDHVRAVVRFNQRHPENRFDALFSGRCCGSIWLTLMLYEVSSANDGDSAEKKIEKLRNKSTELLDMAYAGLTDANLAKMSIGLRTPDYGELLPKMLQSLDTAHRSDPRYLGWARHSYNDSLK